MTYALPTDSRRYSRVTLCATLIADGVEAEADDAVDEIGVGDVGFQGGLREVFVFGQGGVGVGLDEVEFVPRSKAQIEACVTVDGQEVIDAFAGLDDAGGHGRVEAFGEAIFQAPAFPVFLVPLGFVSGNFGFIRRYFFEDEFADGKDVEPMVAEDADVEFAAFDVFLGDDVVVEFLMDELDAFFELLVGFDKGGLGNAQGGLLFEGLDQHGIFQLLRPGDPFAPGDRDKARHANTVIAQDLFGDALVLAEHHAGRAAPGEGDGVHRQEGGDILVEPAIVFELIGEVEDDVGFEGLEFLANQIEVVVNGEMLGGVAKLTEGFEEIGLGLAVLDFEIGLKVLLEGGGGHGIEQGQDFKFAFHCSGGAGYLVRLNLPVKR
jgi:hypothetical protein